MFESDHVSLPEAELARVLRLEVVERLTGGLVQRGGGGAGRVTAGRRHAGVEAGAELRGVLGWGTSGRDEVSAGDVAGKTNSQDPAVTQVLENTPSQPEEQAIP